MKINKKIAKNFTKLALFFILLVLPYSLLAESLLISQTIKPNSKENDPKLTYFQECEFCPKMVVIPPGQIDYKKVNIKSDYLKVDKIIINKAFAMSIYEITWSQWLACVDKKICKKIPSDQGWGKGKLPIINVSWIDAMDYINYLNKITGGSYRLPIELEWQYAARANTKSIYWWGNDVGKNLANCRICGSKWDGEQSSPVGSFGANQFGLFDMNGNVWEWVYDCWDQDNLVNKNIVLDIPIKNCKDRVIKSGSWYYIPKLITPETRHKFPGNLSSYNIGFRVVKDLQ